MPQPLSKTKLSAFRKFLQKKVRVEEGKFMVEGWHLVDEAMKCGGRFEALVFDEGARMEEAERVLLREATERSDSVFVASAEQMGQISDTKASQGIMALMPSVGRSLESFVSGISDEGPVRILILDSVNDPGNVGAIVRTCAWFGMDGVVLGAGSAELENGKTARSSMGGIFHLPIAENADLSVAVAALREKRVQVFSAELDESAASLQGFTFPPRMALVIGNEARGVSRKVSSMADGRVFIPRFGAIESLNAASAASVIMGAWRV